MPETKTSDAGEAFAKDLGYLGKFFDKLEAHASNLPSDHQGRYRQLIADERTRWDEISGILTGKAPAAGGPAVQKSAEAPTAAPAEATAAPAEAKAAPATAPSKPSPTPSKATPARRSGRGGVFTVGSLKRR